jgi:phosphatidate phosphatase PAH1
MWEYMKLDEEVQYNDNNIVHMAHDVVDQCYNAQHPSTMSHVWDVLVDEMNKEYI